jgi:hypothetical protein
MTFVTTPTDVLAAVSWMHGKLVPPVSGIEGISVMVLRGAVVGVADGCTLVAAPSAPPVIDAVGTSNGVFVA